jgi:hypothetical protein
VSGNSPGRAAYEVAQSRLSPKNRLGWDKLKPLSRQHWEEEAQAAIAASDVRDDFLFERQQVIELRQVITEMLTCGGTHDPALFDDDQLAEWRERAGLSEAGA